jgi:hypothetical protein
VRGYDRRRRWSWCSIERRWDVETEVVAQSGTYGCADRWIGHYADGRSTHASRGDGPDLAADDHGVLRLSCLSGANRDIAGVSRVGASRGDRADRHEPGLVKRLVGNHECATPARLFVALDRVQVQVNDCPA